MNLALLHYIPFECVALPLSLSFGPLSIRLVGPMVIYCLWKIAPPPPENGKRVKFIPCLLSTKTVYVFNLVVAPWIQAPKS